MSRAASVTMLFVAAIAALLSVTGCASTTEAPDIATPTSAAPSATAEGDPISANGREAALETATDVMREFLDHDRSYAQWWDALSPYLTDDALVAYSTVDPQRIAGTEVVGPGEVSAELNFNQVSVIVPTDAGQYSVDLLRQGDKASTEAPPWKVDRITPPQETE